MTTMLIVVENLYQDKVKRSIRARNLRKYVIFNKLQIACFNESNIIHTTLVRAIFKGMELVSTVGELAGLARGMPNLSETPKPE